MKTIIAGSREITDYKIVKKAIKKSKFKITEVVSGTARGVDRLGERWAEENNIPIKRFPANWEKYHRAAGPIRNQEMANYAEALIAIPIEGGKGTQNMIKTAKKFELKTFVYNYENKIKIPECKGYKCWTPDGYEYDCEYDTDIVCDDCICVTSKFNDFTGIDPRTNKPFKSFKKIKDKRRIIKI